jgi:hypothetical protein
MRYPSYESRKEHEYFHCSMPTSGTSSTSSTPSLFHNSPLRGAINNVDTEDPIEEEETLSRYNKKLSKFKRNSTYQSRWKRTKQHIWPEQDAEFTLADWQCVLAIVALKRSYEVSTPAPSAPSSHMTLNTVQLDGVN